MLETKVGSFLFTCIQICLLLCYENSTSDGAESISSGQSLAGEHTISSKGGVFELGFFTPGKSQKYYIGIWYKQLQEKTVVWVANRESPLSDKHASELKINKDGNLVLHNPLKRLIWSTNVSSVASNSTVAELLDTGNLVLRDGPSYSSALLWQSFDHPTDTHLPKGRLWKNKITAERLRMRPWKNSEDPAPGMFSWEMDPKGIKQFVLLWNSSTVYFETGVWTRNFFSEIPGMNQDPTYKMSFVETENMSYLTYDYFGQTLTRNFIDPFGQLRQCTLLESSIKWSCFLSFPVSRCDVYSQCGTFGICTQPQSDSAFCSCLEGFEPNSPSDWSSNIWYGGCKRRNHLKCNGNISFNEKNDTFLEISNLEFPVNSHSLITNGEEGCRFSCLKDCSCIAYAYSNGCYVWNGDLINLKSVSDNNAKGQKFFLRVDVTELQLMERKEKRIPFTFFMAIIVGIVLVLGGILLLIWLFYRNKQLLPLKDLEESLVLLSYRDLKSITKNFSHKLGKGSFGSVFKGNLSNSTPVAVKKLEGLRQGEKQFKAEVSTIGTIQHINLIRLCAFCSEGNHKLLVYDYMPNGSLDRHLFHTNSIVIDWKTRYQIALGIARGLSYLHEKCRDCIMHCDIKPENVLLDATFCAKVADFGLSKLFGRDFSRVLTSMRGTIGYLAPEWISGVAVTPKADVYSYGMMLLEIISGKRNSEQLGDGDSAFFPCWAAKKLVEYNFLAMLDDRLKGNTNMEELIRASNLAFWCIQDNENDRPTMGLVVQVLEGVINISMPPIPSSIQIMIGGSS